MNFTKASLKLGMIFCLILVFAMIVGCGGPDTGQMAECPYCGAEIDITDFDAGDTVTCPECGRTSEVVIEAYWQ